MKIGDAELFEACADGSASVRVKAHCTLAESVAAIVFRGQIAYN